MVDRLHRDDESPAPVAARMVGSDIVEATLEELKRVHEKSGWPDYKLAFDILRNPDKIMDLVSNAYHRGFEEEYGDAPGMIRAMMSSDPSEGVTAPIYNGVGLAYNALDERHKILALQAVCHIMDGIRYDIVQLAHTSFINSPEFLADLVTAVPLYWPTTDRAKGTIEHRGYTMKTVRDMLEKDGTFRRDTGIGQFLMAWALLRTDTGNGSLALPFLKIANPEFIERTLRAIAQLRLAVFEKSKENAMKRMRTILPKELLPRMGKYLDEVDTKHVQALQEAFRR